MNTSKLYAKELRERLKAARCALVMFGSKYALTHATLVLIHEVQFFRGVDIDDVILDTTCKAEG
jgi:hypothetical protein